MPRRPLAAVSGNKSRGKELTPNVRGQITGKFKSGVSKNQIGKDLGISPSTVADTIRSKPERLDGKSLSRTGRPKKLSERDKRYIMILIKGNPFLTFREIRDETGLTLSRPTLRKILKESGYGNWIAKKRPKLTQEHANLRYQWALKRKDWTYDRWETIMWSDECSVELGKGHRRQWAFRPNANGEKWKKKYIMPYTKGKGTSMMIWATFWGQGQSDIVPLSRDYESKKQGYSAKSYIKILNEYLLDLWIPGLEFMQDNAPIHRADLVIKWFEEKEIPLPVWPPYSPDLNPIEHVWTKLKELIYDLHPCLEKLTGSDEEKKERMLELIREAWAKIDRDYLTELIKSMDTRVNAVLEAKGWYTRF
jgi:transposase